MHISIELLNHACVIVEYGGVRLLSDPWLTGTCAHGNWGLQYQNQTAFERAAQASHLWVSHVHSDHFHRGSLRLLGKMVPNMMAFANLSGNYDMAPTFTNNGFNQVYPFLERRSVQLASDVSIKRFPASAIDNMLHIRAGQWSVLNYNDCNIPLRSLKSLIRKMGSIDILLTNYNHAGKLFSDQTDKRIQKGLIERFEAIVETVNPRWVVPFASTHYYRAEGSVNQNSSLLTPEELPNKDSKIVPLPIGGKVVFEPALPPMMKEPPRSIYKAPYTIKRHVRTFSLEELLSAAGAFRNKLRNVFGLMWAFPCPVLRVLVSDLGRVIVIDLKTGVFDELPGSQPYHISVHSSSFHNWMVSDFGTDTFSVGGDFDVTRSDITPLRQMLFLGHFADSKIASRQMLGMKLNALKWLWNRREEIYGLLKQGGISLKAGEPRL